MYCLAKHTLAVFYVVFSLWPLWSGVIFGVNPLEQFTFETAYAAVVVAVTAAYLYAPRSYVDARRRALFVVLVLLDVGLVCQGLLAAAGILLQGSLLLIDKEIRAKTKGEAVVNASM